jgi:hypothetical protein
MLNGAVVGQRGGCNVRWTDTARKYAPPPTRMLGAAGDYSLGQGQGGQGRGTGWGWG